MTISPAKRKLVAAVGAGGIFLMLIASVASSYAWRWFASHQVPVAAGDCVFPESWNYHTITAWSSDATFCVRLQPGESVMNVIWSDNHAVIGLFVGSGPMVTAPAGKGTYYTEPNVHGWRIIDTGSHTVTELSMATGGLELSPDGSRAITGQCSGVSCQDVVLDVATGNKLCEFEVYASWHDRGCEGIAQADGQYWDIKALVNRRGCEGYRQYGGSYPEFCIDYVEDYPGNP